MTLFGARPKKVDRVDAAEREAVPDGVGGMHEGNGDQPPRKILADVGGVLAESVRSARQDSAMGEVRETDSEGDRRERIDGEEGHDRAHPHPAEAGPWL